MSTSFPTPELAANVASSGDIVQSVPPTIEKGPSYLTLPGKVMVGNVIGETVLVEAISAIATTG